MYAACLAGLQFPREELSIDRLGHANDMYIL